MTPATRDMTKAQFAEALKRNGFRHEFLWWFKDTTGQTPGVSYGGIWNPKAGRFDRRTTVAHLIKSRAKDVERERKRAERPAKFIEA
jgi:hypothetical protein